MTFDSVILAGITYELNSLLAGSRVDAIHQPSELDVVLTLRSKGANLMLLISADPQSPRVHLTSVKRPNPKTPPSFCMLLRKHLEGARFANASQVGFDRILNIRFVYPKVGDPSQGQLTLVIEIMGKHSNIILVNEANRILGAIKPVGRSRNRFREILPGREYKAPPSHAKVNPLTVTREQFDRLLQETFAEDQADAWLTNTFIGMSPFAARELCLRSAGEPSKLRDEFVAFFEHVRAGKFAPVIISDEQGRTIGFYPYPTVQCPATNQYQRSSVNTVADIYYTVAIPTLALEHAKQDFLARLTRELKSRERAIKIMEEAITENQQADRFKQLGELILSQIRDIPPKAEVVELVDYFAPGNPKVTIRLDPALTASENAQAYFRKYQKAASALETLTDRINETHAEIELLNKVQNSLASVTSIEQLEHIEEMLASHEIHLRQQKTDSSKEKPEFDGHKIKKVFSQGWEILVGQNSDANDYLLTRVAAANDWWVHVKAAPSAHVIIRTNGKPQNVPQSVIHHAAELAVEHSDSRHSSLVPVDYTLKKYVRKPKGAPPGKVLYEREKTLFVTPSGM